MKYRLVFEADKTKCYQCHTLIPFSWDSQIYIYYKYLFRIPFIGNLVVLKAEGLIN